ncbi:MAG TPA: cytochrome c peroxidase [Burkholderiales bacterium]|nr:cytochrome c peroxidase [Burkholderiales bacterium]
MEERRRSLRLCALAGLAFASPAWACTPSLEGTRLESARHVLVYKASSLAVSEHFSVDVEACAKSGGTPKALTVDAHMPAHRHGMNYAPEVTSLGPGRWRAEGLLFHMPGNWELVFVVDGERLAHAVEISFFDEIEKGKILAHGPWPPPARRDPSNRVSGNRAAIALGERLFFEPRLSGTGSVLCATCHVPFRHFQDGRPRGHGLETVDRNTPSLLNVAFYRWYGWDGGHDSLWSQSIRPLLDSREMNASPAHVASTLRSLYGDQYRKAFGRAPPESDEALLVDAGKALAAFQETLISGRTPFDEFRDALEKGEEHDYPLAAQRGLKIFIGKGNCSVCHFGPLFTNGEFADIGVPFFVAPGKVDAGRIEGIKTVKHSPFNLLGRYSDDALRKSGTGTRHVEAQHRNFGEFRVPGLRNVAHTAPYMHNGSFATLADVVRHYSELDEERLHADGERILRPLRLTGQEADDLAGFLRTLSPRGDR